MFCFILVCGCIRALHAGDTATAVDAEKNSESDTLRFFSEGWSGKTGFGYALAYPQLDSGVFQFAEVALETHRHRLLASSETSGILHGGNIRRTNGVLNAGYDITWDRLRLFAFTNYEFGVILGLNSNTALGGGARYTVIRRDKFHFDASIAPIYDRAAYADDTVNQAFSLSGRGRIKIFYSEFSSLFISWFYIAGLNNASNQWHAADVVNNIQLSKKVSIRTGYRWRYDLFSGAAAGLGYLIAVFNFY